MDGSNCQALLEAVTAGAGFDAEGTTRHGACGLRGSIGAAAVTPIDSGSESGLNAMNKTISVHTEKNRRDMAYLHVSSIHPIFEIWFERNRDACNVNRMTAHTSFKLGDTASFAGYLRIQI